MEFSITHRAGTKHNNNFYFARLVGTKRNDNFYFPYFSSFSDLFWLEMNHNRISFFFVEFFTIFMEFSITHRVGTEQNGSIIFISLFLIFFQPILAWNKFLIVSFNFFVIFLEFSSTRLVGTKRNDNFYFPYFSSFSDLFWLEMNHNGISFIFSIFNYFYGIFYYASGRNEMKQ